MGSCAPFAAAAMRSAEALIRWLRRSESRAAIVAAAGVAAVLGLQALLLYGFVAGEYLEEADRQLARQAAFVERMASSSGAAELDRVLDGATRRGDAEVAALDRGEPASSLGVRLRGADGGVVRSWGAWPGSGEPVALGSGLDLWWAGLGLDRSSFLVRRVEGADGLAFEVAAPLARYRAELDEVRDGLLAILGVSFVAGIAIALLALRRSLRPLREATQLLTSIDAERIGTRLPERGTGDFVDQHAVALNAALGRLSAAFERLRSFSSDVAHELRTPISRIRNTAEVGLMESAGRPDAREALQGILRSVEDLGRLVEALLLLARLDEGRQRIESSPLSVREWLGGLLELYRPLCAEREIELRAALEPLSLAGDRTLLDRALCNLLDNALLHGGEGRRIEVAARAERGGVELSVADAGPGVPSRERERIFDRFSRLDAARSRGGAGVGLALARAIAKAHGGSLGVGESPLGGARFVLWLPGAVRTAGVAQHEDFVIHDGAP